LGTIRKSKEDTTPHSSKNLLKNVSHPFSFIPVISCNFLLNMPAFAL